MSRGGNVKPTKEQIENERKKLLEMLPNIRPRSAFGDDHHAAVHAAMRVLSGRDTAEEYDDYADNIRNEVYNVEQWMNGEADEEYGSPSQSWAELLQK